MTITTTQYAGHEALNINAGAISLIATTSIGPRILGLLTADGANAFVELPDLTLPCPGSDPIHLYGGHRHWAAPEDPRVTYRPDDQPVGVKEIDDGVRLTTRADDVSGTSRETVVHVTDPERVTVEHRVLNHRETPQRMAAWAITMLKPGGRAWLPMLTTDFDPGGFQGQRNVVLWSYSRQDDPRFVLSDAAIEIRSSATGGVSPEHAFKVGTSLRRGWVAHWREGVLFVKRASHDERRDYADMGASGQVYSHVDFTELETLGPLTDVEPGGAAVHTEMWEVYLVGEAEAEDMVTSGKLDR